jgi:HSP20 family protein
MKNNITYSTGSSIYPGEYVPLLKENDFKKAVKYSYKKKANALPVNIAESGDSYKIELIIPGVERENLFLKICDNVLIVSVIHEHKMLLKQKKFQMHEFAFDDCYTRKIVLPDNADTLFISAEYRSGILQLHVPKSTNPLKGINTKIAVY